MKKEQLLKLYEDYLERNPQERYIKNLENSQLEGRPRFELIERAYLRNNEVLKDVKLPKFLKYEQVRELNSRYHDELKWDVIETGVTTDQIKAFEQEKGVTLPRQFCEYLQGYSLPQVRFYPERAADGSDPGVMVEFFGIGNPDGLQYYADFDWESADLLESMGLLHIGVINREEWLFLDCETGEVQSWEHEEIALEAESREEFWDESSEGSVWFEDFDSFLEWLFGKTSVGERP